MLTIADFNKPKEHPFNMLDGYKHACEKEQTLRWLLNKCIEASDLDAAIETKHNHPTMVSDGLLETVGAIPLRYKLTRKAKGLLYAWYGNETTD